MSTYEKYIFKSLRSLAMVLCTLSTSCSFIVESSYGIGKPKPLSESEIIAAAKQYNIHDTSLYELQESYTKKLLASLKNTNHDDTEYPLEGSIQDHLQPLQMLWFNNDGKLISFHVNCYAGGFPNLRWNTKKVFNQYPPATSAALDTLVSLPMVLSSIKPLSASHISPQKSKYVAIIFWNKHMGRQSRRALETFRQNLMLDSNETTTVLYVNNDNVEVATQ